MKLLLGLGAATEAERARRLLAASGRRGDSPLAGVTRRERDVLRLLADGLTNRQIAARLVISEHTVHRHVANILRKLDLPSRTAAVAHAVRSGLRRRIDGVGNRPSGKDGPNGRSRSGRPRRTVEPP